ncbi:MAG: PBSX family phage terminase large subunit [Ruminococcaceae bacterium]|nr:PBSX family phage terminase large subunit [Oscillospiraceae bacterium]
MSSYIFGEKHREYMRRARRCTVNVAEGAVRAGKTVDNVFAFAAELEVTADRFHLASGSTLGNAKLNIGECNGLGLEHIFGERAKWGRWRTNECMTVQTAAGEKIIIFTGGKNADSYKRIRGNSYGLWIATEVNLHADSFIKEAMNRQLAAVKRKVFWDLNPSSPKSFIYQNYLDRYEEMARTGEVDEDFYNYARFTIRDNPIITPERLREIEAQYDKDSVWYRRDILGERCAAEGVIYHLFANDPSRFTVDGTDGAEIDFINIGVDFGGNRSRTTFVAAAFLGGARKGEIRIVKDHAVSGGKGEIDPDVINSEMARFLGELKEEYGGARIKYIFCDSEAQYLINGLRRSLRGFGVTVADCAKKRIRDRIAFVNGLLATGRFTILSRCRLVADGLANAVWDDSAEDKRLDDFTSDIDILDAMEYAIERYMTSCR